MSTEGQLTINFHRLRETSQHIGTTVGSMRTQLDQLEQDAAPLVATWSGEARQAYEQRQNIWRQASAELTAVLRAIQRALDETIVDFERTERVNTGLFQPGRG